MTTQIRPLDPSEVDEGLRVFLRAMVGLPLRDLDAVAITEPGRYLGAVEDGRVVGSADSYTSWLVVPGGQRVPHAAVTHIGVLPTHRRRGIVTRLVRHQLEDVAARGEVVATLRASEARIYERFGYGVASSSHSLRVCTVRAELRASTPAGGEVRLVDDATIDLLAGLHDRAQQTAAIHRPEGWWRLREQQRAAARVPQYVVVHSTDGVDDGYAAYHPEDTEHWFTSSERTITVTDLVALSPSARVGLWRHLLSLDLVDVVVLESLPLDDPLPLALVDRRAATSSGPRDETWLRLVDVEAALRARTYGHDDPVVLGVVDSLLPANSGSYEVGPKEVVRTTAEPEVVADVATLAAAYLGGTRFDHLAAIGRLDVRRPDAVRRLDVLFGGLPEPWSGTAF